jgi:ribosome modulation factor
MADHERKLKAVAHVPVPLPETTPFDSDSDARRAYLDYYTAGYREGIAGYSSSCCLLDVPDRQARVAGWYDGNGAGWNRWADENLIIKTSE